MKYSPEYINVSPQEKRQPPTEVGDQRPSPSDLSNLVQWLLRRYVISQWDNSFEKRLQMVLKRDVDGSLIPDGKVFRMERKGVAVTAPSQDGKTTMVVQVLKRLFNDGFTDTRCGQHIAYCRLRGDATVKSVCMDLCRTTGYSNFPSKLTRAEANDLATHRLRLAGIRIVVIDEVHNLLGKAEPVNLFLKTLVQDGGGFCVILIGTPKVRAFIYDKPDNIELAERYLDFPLEPFDRGTTLQLISVALKAIASDAQVGIARSISKDPYFADRVYDGVRGSYGRCMLLVATSIAHALEEGDNTVDIEDFELVFDILFRRLNPENPFAVDDWSPASEDVMSGLPLSGDSHLRGAAKSASKRKTGTASGRAGMRAGR